MTNAERETLVDIRKAAEIGLRCISCGNNCISRLWQIVGLCDAALEKPQERRRRVNLPRSKKAGAKAKGGAK